LYEESESTLGLWMVDRLTGSYRLFNVFLRPWRWS
jgi:predicted ATP-grasp superfamily ATP-dependent carboligase